MSLNKSVSIRRAYGFLLCCFLTAALMLLLAADLAAQSSTTGDVSGVVSDPSGAIVPGATVTLKSNETGRTSTAKTNNTGVYRFSLLSPGPYTITVSSPNFSPASVQVPIAVGQSITANVHLQVASAQQVVEVQAEGSNVQADNGNISTTMTHVRPNSSSKPPAMSSSNPKPMSSRPKSFMISF